MILSVSISISNINMCCLWAYNDMDMIVSPSFRRRNICLGSTNDDDYADVGGTMDIHTAFED